jgi:hypothetical protein
MCRKTWVEVAGVSWRRSKDDGREELETKVTGTRTVEDYFGTGTGLPRTVMTEEEEEWEDLA